MKQHTDSLHSMLLLLLDVVDIRLYALKGWLTVSTSSFATEAQRSGFASGCCRAAPFPI